VWKSTKTILLLVLSGFIIGLIPTILSTIDYAVVYSAKEGLSLHPHFIADLKGFLHTLKNYTWHITILYACVVAFIIFMEEQNPDRTVLWLLTLVFVPVIGIIVYLFVGPDLHYFKKRKLFRPPKEQDIDRSPFSSDKRFLTGRMIHACSGADLLLHNDIRILINGEETFSRIKKELASAEHYIHMQYFIINDDEIGCEIRDILIGAAKRGVKIRVLYDAIGSWKLGRKYVESLIEAGIQCHSFMPVSMPMLRRKMNFRNHRKILVIDDRVAFTGGLNVGDEYMGRGHLGHWRDTHVLVEGEAVRALHQIFLRDWCLRWGEDPHAIYHEIKCDDCGAAIAPEPSKYPILPMQVVASGIDNAWHSIAQGYFSMISRAKERVWITTPYFVPGQAIMNAIAATALSGVDVRILLPSKKDHFLVFWGSRGNIEPMLRAGVRVFLYEKGFVHTKSVLADEGLSSVGTCNMDVRSLEINFEDQLFIYDNDVNSAFAERFRKDLEDSRELDVSEWEKRPLWQKILESFGRLYSAQI
jgi:cardiolipin synthase